MRKLVLKMSISLDAFCAGPKGESDWIFSTLEEEALAWEMEIIAGAGLHAMGSHTYKDMAAHWPWSTEVFAAPMNEIPKVVFSHRSLDELRRDADERLRSLKDTEVQQVTVGAKKGAKAEPTNEVLEGWRNPRLLSGPLPDELRRLKEENGKPVIVYGGAELAGSVIASGLVDDYFFLIHPAALGKGLPIFTALEKPIDLELVSAKAFKGGTIGTLYRPKKS